MNGIEQDVRDIRRDIQKIDRDGCAHKRTHDEADKELWKAVGEIRDGQGALFMKIVLSVFGIVLGLLIANVYVTKQTVAETAKEVKVKSDNLEEANHQILENLAAEIRDIKATQTAQRDIMKAQQRTRK